MPKKLFKLKLLDDRHLGLTINTRELDSIEYTRVYNLVCNFREAVIIKKTGVIKIPLTSDNVEYLNKTWKPSEYVSDEYVDTTVHYEKLQKKVQRKKYKRMLEYLFEGITPDPPSNNQNKDLSIEERWKASLKLQTLPFKHQIVALDAMHTSEYFGLLMEMGTGKSKAIVDECIWQVREKNKKVYKVLIVAPKTICYNWEREFLKHMPKDIKWFWRRLRKHENLIQDLIDGTKIKASLKIWVINYDGVQSNLLALESMDWDLMVLDESTAVKNPKAKRTKAIFQLAKRAYKRVILTGTPSPNSVLDLWGQFNFLKIGSLGFDTFDEFRRHYADIEERYGRVTGLKNFEELKQRLAECSFIVKKSQCLDLPPKSYTTFEVEMGEEHRAAYDEMKNNCLLELEMAEKAGKGESPLAIAQIVLVQYLRLSQICCGFTKDTEGRIHSIPKGNAKLAALKDIFEELDDTTKVLIWTRFREDVKRIGSFLESKHIFFEEIHGDVHEKRRMGIQDEFNTDEGPRVIIGLPSAGGLGMTLVGSKNRPCTTAIYYSNDFNLLTRLQSEDRCHRIGTTRPVTYIDIICENSIEEYISKCLQNKEEFQNKVKDMKSFKAILLGHYKDEK